MYVRFIIIEVNMHSPHFILNSQSVNYCETTYQAYENTKFTIEILATDDDERGENGRISIFAPEMSDRSPQNSFSVNDSVQLGRNRRATVYNLETFDYENPKSITAHKYATLSLALDSKEINWSLEERISSSGSGISKIASSHLPFRVEENRFWP